MMLVRLSQWPGSLRRLSTAGHLLGLLVSNPARGLDVCVLCVVR
jgi:hypothetical protein